LNVSNPANPSQVAYLPEVGDPNHITAAGDYVYLTTGYEWTGFQIVDITDPSNPINTGGIIGDDMLAGGYDIALDGDRAYVADGGSVRILNVGDPYNPTHLGVYFPPEFYNYIYSVATYGGLVYYTDAEDLAAIDATDPTSPTLAIEYGHAVSWGMDVEISGDRAYVAAEQYGLKVLDLGNSYAGVETHLTPGLASQVEIVDNLVYVALNDGGLGIYAIGQYTSNLIPTSGGSLVLPDNSLQYDFPAWTFSSTVVVTHTVLLSNQVPTIPADNLSNGTAFSVEAAYRSNGLPAQPSSYYTVTVNYDPEALGPIKDDTLGLFSWDGAAWHLESGPPDTTNHTITATPDHFSYWIVMGETEKLYLPMVPSRH
jgi:hypothetical protein